MLTGLTIRGRCLLAAGAAAAVCALVLDERDLLRVAAFVTALPLLALWTSGRTRFGLHAQRELAPARAPVDSEVNVRLHLGARGRIPVGDLVLDDGLSHTLGVHARFLLDQPLRGGSTTVDYQLRARLRGVHQVGPLRTHVSDPLGLSEFERELAGSSRLVIVPQVMALHGLPAGSGFGMGEDGARHLRAGHGEDDTMLRQYRHGDDMRRVHWKATARRDELMVRVEEQPQHGGVAVLVDDRACAHRGHGRASSIEWAISAAASVCLHLHRHGQQVRLVTVDGTVLAGGGAQGGSPTGDGGHDDNVVLDALATLKPAQQRDLLAGTDPGGGRGMIAVLGAMTPAEVSKLSTVRPAGMRSLALLLDVDAWDGEAVEHSDSTQQAASQLREAGWMVSTVPGPDASVASAWQALCGSQHAGVST